MRQYKRKGRRVDKSKNECKLGPQDLEFCGPIMATDTETCCEKIRVAEEIPAKKRKPSDTHKKAKAKAEKRTKRKPAFLRRRRWRDQ